MSWRTIIAGLGLAGSLSLGVTTLVSAKVRETVEETIPFDAGGELQLTNVNGEIRLETWDEPNLRITAEKVAETESRLRDISIDIRGSGGRVEVETRFERRRGGGRVDYEIRIPAEANVRLRTTNGKVLVEGLGGNIEVASVNGGVELSDIAGDAEASTTNGSIRVEYRDPGRGHHSYTTTNGSVRVLLPAGSGGEIDARTVNGSIDVDFATTIETMGRRRLRGSFGGGGARYEISTVNGSIGFHER